MKQTAWILKGNFSKIFSCLFLCGLFFLSGCGIEDVIVLDMRGSRINFSNTVTNNDTVLNYFHFRTWNGGNAGSRMEIYYKVYNNQSTLKSDSDSINNINTSSTAQNNAWATRMKESYGFQLLRLFNFADGQSYDCSEKISAVDGTEVKIRLYKESDEYTAGVWINDVSIGMEPVRVNGYSTTSGDFTERDGFDFFDKYEMKNKVNNDLTKIRVGILPASGDKDYKSSTSDGEVYYVKMYAVVSVFDPQFVPYYSRLLDLGECYIKK